MDVPTTLHNQITREYRGVWDQVRDFLNGRGRDLPDWPEWCYMPMAGAYAVVSGGESGVLPPEKQRDISVVSAVAAWRPTRTNVEIEEDLLETLWRGEMPETVEADDLASLPAWGIYVDLGSVSDAPAGAILHLEHDVGDGHAEFRALGIEESLETFPALLDLKGDPEEGARSVLEEAVRVGEKSKQRMPVEVGTTSALAEHIRPFLSIALYLGSEASAWSPERPTRLDRRPREGAASSTVYQVS